MAGNETTWAHYACSRRFSESFDSQSRRCREVEARAVCDLVGVMSEGRLVQTESPDELTDDPAAEAAGRLLCPPAAEMVN